MGLLEILLIAFGVSADAAAVSISGSLCPGKFSRRHRAFNAALFFGGFQFLMPLLGFYSAGIFSDAVKHFDHFLAFGLLSSVGIKMIWETFRKTDGGESCRIGEFFAAKNLIIPAIATSIDALAIGAGLVFSGTDIWLPASAMGLVTAIISSACVLLGTHQYLQKLPAKKMTILAGIIIILIGTRILLQDTGWLY